MVCGFRSRALHVESFRKAKQWQAGLSASGYCKKNSLISVEARKTQPTNGYEKQSLRKNRSYQNRPYEKERLRKAEPTKCRSYEVRVCEKVEATKSRGYEKVKATNM